MGAETRTADPARSTAVPTDATGAPAVEVTSVSKIFRDGHGREVHALADVSFTVGAGEIVGLSGHSGCGKTTLIRIIMGLETPTSGTVSVDGELVRGCGPDRGIVFQHAELLPWRTALGNVLFALESHDTPKSDRRPIAEHVLELVGLASAMNRRPHELSGGMRQRVGIARALAIDPMVLLMDEPFSALDARTREGLQGELLDIQARTGKTILFVSHDLDESVLLADRVVAMVPDPGRLHAVLDTRLDTSLSVEQRRGSPEFAEKRAELWRMIHSAGDEREGVAR
jgi:ABC-type nitrate/sulfonate/bicarbonate transport system ATPase subunit